MGSGSAARRRAGRLDRHQSKHPLPVTLGIFEAAQRRVESGTLNRLTLGDAVDAQDADLAETLDVQLTPAIRAKAAELKYRPLDIENWVRNNIRFLPTWGSIQGADGTLKTMRGNAFDTASLTIALLRASGIPARYQFGTIEMPAEAVMNWVGGVQRPEAALNLLYQGGIAARGIASAGRLGSIRMEHVWVNAYVNWTPSRGARQGGNIPTPPILAAHGQPQHPNPNAQLNAWVPLDGAFKQYNFTQGMNLKTAVPVDANALIAAVQQGATVTPNYAQNLNQQALLDQINLYQNQTRSYINSQPTGATSTVGDVLGTQVIQTRTLSLLPGTLPYATVVQGNERAELPDGLRWKVDFHGYEVDGAGGQGSTLINRSFNLSELLRGRVGIAYEGATPADQQAIANYRISGATSFPAYALRVRPLFQIDGGTIVQGDSAGMGKDVEWRVNIIPAGQSANSGNQLQTYPAAAGDEMVWAIAGDTVSAAQLQSLSFPNTPAGQLHAVGMSYWHQVDAYAHLVARREAAVALRMPSLGAVSSGLRVQFIWGVARNAHYLGRTIDIGHSTIGVQGMDSVAFQREIGLRTSYLEGNIFDQVFGRETGAGISAVGLIQTALESGQRVFTLNSGNADQFLGLVQMSAALREEVINSLIAGLEVTIPEFTQNVNGWQGTAYIAIRPETGAGAYIISGGLRGGDEGGDCQLQPATNPAQSTNFGPAVLFAAAIIALLLIARIGPVVGILIGAAVLTQTAGAAPGPQLKPPLDNIWNRLSGGRPWPTQFNWPPAGMPNLPVSGTCTAEQHAALEAPKVLACENPLAKEACKGNMSCELLEQKAAAVDQCIVARIAVMDICFQGGDPGHWQAIQDLLGRGNNCIKCLSRQQAQQCRSPQ